jgi:hypothetical protein
MVLKYLLEETEEFVLLRPYIFILFIDISFIQKLLLSNIYRTIRAGLTGNRSDCTLSDQSFASSSSADLPQQKMKELRAQEAYQLEQSIAKTIQRKTQNAAYQKEKTYSNLVSNIEKSMSFLDSVDKNILLMEETKRNKTRRQFEDWNTQIHGNIQVSSIISYTYFDFTQLNCVYFTLSLYDSKKSTRL